MWPIIIATSCTGPLPPSESLIFYFSLPAVFPHELGPQEPVQNVQIPASSAVELGSEGHDTNSWVNILKLYNIGSVLWTTFTIILCIIPFLNHNTSYTSYSLATPIAHAHDNDVTRLTTRKFPTITASTWSCWARELSNRVRFQAARAPHESWLDTQTSIFISSCNTAVLFKQWRRGCRTRDQQDHHSLQ